MIALRKWITLIGMLCLAWSFTACAAKKDAGEDVVITQIESSQGGDVNEEKEPAVEETNWVICEVLDFAMELPKDVNVTANDLDDVNLVFRGEKDSLMVELSRWDQLSLPKEEALAELVTKATGMNAEVVEQNGRSLIKVNWPHGEVNYYLLAKNGDAYVLWITPYVMKDPDVYEKVRAIEGSFCKASNLAGKGNAISVAAPATEEIDYWILVDKKNPLPNDWEGKLDLVTMVNSVGDIVPVERTAYKAYLELKEELWENEGIDVDLDSAYRSVQYQQDILDRFTEKYGAAYAARTVAKPGYSEHHTGLALDLYFRLDGKEVYENEDLIQYPEVWKKIHARLAEHGFILRYPGGENGTVDYSYEPWHIRYVGVEAAKEIAASPGLLFEDWLSEK